MIFRYKFFHHHDFVSRLLYFRFFSQHFSHSLLLIYSTLISFFLLVFYDKIPPLGGTLLMA